MSSEETLCKIVHIKLHCILKKKEEKCFCSNEKRKKHTKNFCIYKHLKPKQKITFVIFKSGFVNICGIRDISEIEDILHLLQKLTQTTEKKLKYCFKLLQNKKRYQIDNITLSGQLHTKLPFCFYIADNWVKQNLTEINSTYNDLHFPGWFISFEEEAGKIVLFRTGKFSLLGLKCLERLPLILDKLNAFTTKLLSARIQGQLSAWNAV